MKVCEGVPIRVPNEMPRRIYTTCLKNCGKILWKLPRGIMEKILGWDFSIFRRIVEMILAKTRIINNF